MNNCIFEDKPCRYANKSGNAFTCTAPSDDEMPCRNKTRTSGSGMHSRPSSYEMTRAAVYATGNRWAIENFNATH